MKFLVVLACVVALSSAEYAPSGWKPQGARLTLPTEYGPPAQVQPQEQDLEIEITKENLEYVGQLGETTTEAVAAETTTEFLQPTTTDVPEEAPEENADPLTTQQLPNRDNSRSFHEQPKRVGQLRRLPLRFQRQQAEPKDTYGAPPAPTTTTEVPEVEPEVELATQENFNVPEPEEVETEQEEIPEASIAVANSGQYYVLAPDNTLQRVTFYTRQSEDDRRTNGFTAELRYAPVEPIRDPIYAYNQQGQLVRVYNKK